MTFRYVFEEFFETFTFSWRKTVRNLPKIRKFYPKNSFAVEFFWWLLTKMIFFNSLQDLHILLTHATNIEVLDLSATGIPLEKLFAPLQYGALNLRELHLANAIFSHKKWSKHQVVPQAVKNFFASARCLKFLNLSDSQLPPEVLK